MPIFRLVLIAMTALIILFTITAVMKGGFDLFTPFFGPIVAIMRVADETEALRLANDSEYGLNGNVWTRDKEKGFRIAQQMETGGVCINDMAITYGIPEAPFGGVKASGVGQVNGEMGLKGYCQALPIVIDRLGGRQAASLYPYSHKKDAGMQKFMRWLFGTRLGRWLS